MSIYEQMETLKKNVSSVHDPAMLFAMNKKYRELQDQLNNINVNFTSL